MKKIAAVYWMVLLSSGLASASFAGEAEQSIPSGVLSWRNAYTDILDGMGEERENYDFALIYVDEDEIPELVCYSGVEAGGCQIYTWHDGVTDQLQTHRLGYSYIEKRNLLRNSDGIQGAFFDLIYEIQDGRWVEVADGGYSAQENVPEAYCRWDGQDVDRSSYDALLNQVYETDAERTPENYYVYDEMYALMSQGQTLSASHSYEIIRADVSWHQAEEECRARGGYLAAITSPEEMEQIAELAKQSGYGDCVLWVGATRKDRFGYRWITPQKEYDMINNSFFPFWLDGEPSYTGVTEDGWEAEEEYVTMFYLSAQNRWCLNDVPDEILEAAPSYAGSVGYVCEYE